VENLDSYECSSWCFQTARKVGLLCGPKCGIIEALLMLVLCRSIKLIYECEVFMFHIEILRKLSIWKQAVQRSPVMWVVSNLPRTLDSSWHSCVLSRCYVSVQQ
jgi:hypothetical protein